MKKVVGIFIMMLLIGAAVLPAMGIINVEKIDIVYAWVDGNDQAWRNKKQEYLDEEIKDEMNETAFSYSRFMSRNELKYSLRSVYKYIDYVENIYIVTDGQRPSWLSESSDVRIIDHRDIFSDSTVSFSISSR